VEIRRDYDRSALIQRAVDNLNRTARTSSSSSPWCASCSMFHVPLRPDRRDRDADRRAVRVHRHALQGINATSCRSRHRHRDGALVDAAIVMTENVHRKLERGVAGERERSRRSTRLRRGGAVACFLAE